MHHSWTRKPLRPRGGKWGPCTLNWCYDATFGFQGALPNKEQLKSTTSVYVQLFAVIVLAVPNLKAVAIQM